MPHLFDPLKIRDIQFANRVLVSPMCVLQHRWICERLAFRAPAAAALWEVRGLS